MNHMKAESYQFHPTSSSVTIIAFFKGYKECRADNTRLFELMITKFNAHLFPFPSVLCNFAARKEKQGKRNKHSQ